MYVYRHRHVYLVLEFCKYDLDKRINNKSIEFSLVEIKKVRSILCIRPQIM